MPQQNSSVSPKKKGGIWFFILPILLIVILILSQLYRSKKSEQTITSVNSNTGSFVVDIHKLEGIRYSNSAGGFIEFVKCEGDKIEIFAEFDDYRYKNLARIEGNNLILMKEGNSECATLAFKDDGNRIYGTVNCWIYPTLVNLKRNPSQK